MMHTYSENREILVPPIKVFEYLDDHQNLFEHMGKSSWMMGGGKMKMEKENSHIKMTGRAFGLPVELDEVITVYDPPKSKVWETVGTPKLWVIGHYQMGFKIEEKNKGSQVEVFVKYDLPKSNTWLGKLFGQIYAKWCVQQMLASVTNHFHTPPGGEDF